MKKVSRYVVILFAIAALVSCGNGKKGSASEKAKQKKLKTRLQKRKNRLMQIRLQI